MTTKPRTMPPGPYSAPEGTTPTTYAITITAVIPNVHTDPSLWDFGALTEQLTNQPELLTDITSVELVPAGGEE